MSTNKRAWWGDLRLWYHGRGYTEDMKRTTSVAYPGVEQQEVLPIGRGPNFDSRVEVATVFAPTTNYSQEDYRSTIAAMLDALASRAGGATPGQPLVWVKDHTAAATVTGYAGPTVTCAAGHPFINGDRVHVPSLGNGWMYGSVSNVSGNDFDITALGNGTRDPAASDLVYLVERCWPGWFFDSMPMLPMGADGDYHNPNAKYVFKGSRTSVYTRTVVALDLDLG